jgi:hypothetical protein
MMDGFKVTILHPGDAVMMEPGMIHAVVSPTNLAIGCWECMDAIWLDSNYWRGAQFVISEAIIDLEPIN